MSLIFPSLNSLPNASTWLTPSTPWSKSQMQLPPGQAVLAMVLDTLSGRSPLYRLKEFFHEKDTELLLGTEIDPELFCDYNLGRVIDKIYDTGTHAIFSRLSQNAVRQFGIDARKQL
jgi:hypothetical protein